MLVKKKIEYLGIEGPDTPAQVRVEIAGLKQAIKVAEEVICRFEQALAIAELKREENLNAGFQETSGEENSKAETKEGDGEGH